MELQWIKTFLAAADYGNFRKTAEQLFISQPTVTVHIKQLEKELGMLLFQREGKKIKLTEAGRRYRKHARKLMNVYESGMEDLQMFSQGFTTKLSLGISPLIADTVLPFVLKQYIKKHPQVEISIEIIESKDIEKAVLDEVVDIGLSCLQSFHAELKSILLYQDKVVLVAPHDGRDFESALPIDEEEILSSGHLLTHNHPGYWEGLCRTVKRFYPGIRMMKVSQIHITRRFIAEGLGVSYLPSATVRRELLEGRLIEVESRTFPLPKADTYAVLKYHHQEQKEFLAFLSHFRF
ncbi:LysR family transcriptional regulator, repressor for citA [Evansella caseinilytica]|uniref:LysR family transcriptional regulator, repressor for citA n=1 Tax=Evansella caseinilytica TaxID=1503961 RepID=A0A1H3SZG5_9BACI|nr:LysR family transcriptional regulator [Evansella caseinilytica]SDZ43382.1 LysR family transcriptional regulator, repressor for citA [Evansella caseinilytica]